MLAETIQKMIAPQKGLLAADESTGTIGKRFDSIGVENTEEHRRVWRDILFTTDGHEQYISGVILFEETLMEHAAADGTRLADVLQQKGILPGIKVDRGMREIGGVNNEKVTQGFDDLAERCATYFEAGARFAKWRAAIEIDTDAGLPSDLAIQENARGLARYAAICQGANLVPIVEPEVVMKGIFTMDAYADVTTRVQKATFAALKEFGVVLEHIILKPNMIIPSSDGGETATPEEVAERTYAVLQECVPAEVPGIMFLSGGQTEDSARETLAALNQIDDAPWVMSYSYGRALQASALATWQGKEENRAAAQEAYMQTASALSAIVRG